MFDTHQDRAIVNSTEQLIKHVQDLSTLYLKELFRLKCASDLLATNFFPNGKEWTESAAAFHTARKFPFRRGFAPEDRDIVAVCIADGSTPRTAAMFAFRTGWNCYSIDPAMSRKEGSLVSKSKAVQRLHILPNKIEDVPADTWEGKKIIFIAVHSHANLGEIRRFNTKEAAAIAIECCVKQELEDREPDFEFRDRHILSPANLVKVWLDTRIKK